MWDSWSYPPLRTGQLRIELAALTFKEYTTPLIRAASHLYAYVILGLVTSFSCTLILLPSFPLYHERTWAAVLQMGNKYEVQNSLAVMPTGVLCITDAALCDMQTILSVIQTNSSSRHTYTRPSVLQTESSVVQRAASVIQRTPVCIIFFRSYRNAAA